MRKLASGHLQVDEIHKIYWVEYGDPKGEPLLMIHGGLSCSKKKGTKNKEGFRIIMFDQRGVGKSLPHGEIKNNSTEETLNDINKLLAARNIEKTHIWGTSWGSSLSLLYAEKFPEKIKSLNLASIFLARKEDINWGFYGAKLFYPDYYEKITSFIPTGEKSDIVKYFSEKINNGTFKEKQIFAREIIVYEMAIMNNFPSQLKYPPQVGPYEIEEVKIFLHYFVNGMFIKKGQEILANIDKIKHIQTIIVHGRTDTICPITQAYELHKNLPNSELIIEDGENHISKQNVTTLTTKIKKYLNK